MIASRPSRSSRTVSCGSSASTVPTPAMIASTVLRSSCTSVRAGAEVIHWLVPSAAAERPSRVAANFQVRYGRLRRTAVSQATLPASASARRTPVSTSTPAAAQGGRAAGRDRRRVVHRDDHALDPGGDQRLRAGAGAPGVVARLEGDHRGAAPGALAGLGQRDDLGVRAAGVRVEALADDLAVGAEQQAADDRVGAGRAEAPGGQRDRAAHRLVLGHHRGPFPARHGHARKGEKTPGNGHHGYGDRRPGSRARRSAPSVRFPRAVSHPDCLTGRHECRRSTVGPGVSPGPPSVVVSTSGSRAYRCLRVGSPPVRNFTESRQRVVGHRQVLHAIRRDATRTVAQVTLRSSSSGLAAAAVDRHVRAGLALGDLLHLGRHRDHHPRVGEAAAGRISTRPPRWTG